MDALDDAEAELVARERPLLRSILFEGGPVQVLARRPFFLAVLARLPQATRLLSEIDLVEAWWRAGGYDEHPDRVPERQAAIMALAREGATTLGRRMAHKSVAASALAALRRDGVIRDVRPGHTVAFAHDIYFEWAYLHWLLENGAEWPAALCGRWGTAGAGPGGGASVADDHP